MQSQIPQLKQLGVQAFERREYALALEHFRAILAERPGFVDIRHYAGLCLIFLGQSDEALEQIDLALDLNPGYVEAHINRALLLQELGRYDEARESFKLAGDHEQHSHSRFSAAVTAGLANAHAAVGDLYHSAEAYEEAADQYRAALDLRPRFHDIRNKYAAALLALNKPGEARDELERILDWNPRFSAARLNLGLALHRLGEIHEAAAEWQECARQHPDNPQVRAYLSMLEKQHATPATDEEQAHG
jgi:tetratricopeptide (TPR) repeat protein